MMIGGGALAALFAMACGAPGRRATTAASPTAAGALDLGSTLLGRSVFDEQLGGMARAEWRVLGLASIGRMFQDGASALEPGELAHCADSGSRAPGCAMLERKAIELRELAKQSFERCRETAALLDVGHPWATLCGPQQTGRPVLIITPVPE